MDTSIYVKLNQIQVGLKAPKGQYNNFGKYNYRSCEDILEGVKPLLADTKTVLILTDEPVLIGNYQYIKATASIIDSETGARVDTTACAREPESQSGMGAAQLTGSTSSYARKYALSGLLAIDDTKDDDATNQGPQGGQGQQRTSQGGQPPTKQQLKANIVSALQAKQIPLTRMTKYLQERYNTHDILSLTINQMLGLEKEVASW